MAAIDPRAHLGRGWAFPVVPRNGRLRYAAHEEDIEQAIQIILTTTPGERVRRPGFGAGLGELVFEPNNSATHRTLETTVDEALRRWEPRIELEQVEVVADAEAFNRVLIHIDYRVRATNTFYNRVFPFYLFEGAP